MNKDIIIAGSGLTGATLAYLHKQNGDKVTVYERRNHVGGNCYTETINGIDVHKYGAHIFHTDDADVWKFINRFGAFNNYVHTVKTMLDGKVYSLPVNMNTFNEVFGITKPEDLTQDHVNQVYQMFFKGYTRKQWGFDNNQKDVISRIPFRTTFDNRYFNDSYQGIPVDGLHCDVDDYAGADIIYHTGMIDEFMGYYLGELGYRSLELREERLPVKNYQGCPVMNEAAEIVPYTRTIEHKWFNQRPGMEGTVITREYPKAWGRGRDAYYVMADDKNRALYDSYVNLVRLKYPNMVFCGRLGSYRYHDMDDAIREAIYIFKKTKIELWKLSWMPSGLRWRALTLPTALQ